MTMQIAYRTSFSPATRRVSWRHIAGILVLTVTIILMASSSAASGKGRVGVFTPKALFACYHKKIHRFTATIKPIDCEIAGIEEKTKKFVNFPIQNLRWSSWGSSGTRGAFGVNTRTGSRVRVFASHRVRCADDRVFYSVAIVSNLQSSYNYYSLLSLPVCSDPALVGPSPD